MPKIVVIGGGVVGLSAALMLASAGHEVTVVERDDGGLPGSPEEAWQGWQRRGVAQFRQPHFLHATGYRLLAERLPEVAQVSWRRVARRSTCCHCCRRSSPTAHGARETSGSPRSRAGGR